MAAAAHHSRITCYLRIAGRQWALPTRTQPLRAARSNFASSSTGRPERTELADKVLWEGARTRRGSTSRPEGLVDATASKSKGWAHNVRLVNAVDTRDPTAVGPSRPGPTRVLAVDDDEGMRSLLTYALEGSGFEVVLAATGDEAAMSLASSHPDLVVLDIGLPDGDGFELCWYWRSQGIETPVVFLSGRDATEDKVRGFRAGGDDYVTKPFAVEELLARIRAVMRRNRGNR
jgi:CheY-like chemotaxis protein